MQYEKQRAQLLSSLVLVWKKKVKECEDSDVLKAGDGIFCLCLVSFAGSYKVILGFGCNIVCHLHIVKHNERFVRCLGWEEYLDPTG